MAEEGQLAIELSQRIAKKPDALSAWRCVRFVCSVGSVAEHFFRTEETAVRFGYGTPFAGVVQSAEHGFCTPKVVRAIRITGSKPLKTADCVPFRGRLSTLLARMKSSERIVV